MSEELPKGTEFIQMMSVNDFLFASIHNVIETLVIAIILVVLVVYFFLHDFKSTLIPSISIIVSLIGTFAFFVGSWIQYQYSDTVCFGIGYRNGCG